MTIFPGAVWRPMPGQEKRPRRRKGRGVGFHVAVHRGPSIYDINRSTGNDAHLYVRADGTVEQNVDLDLQAWAGVDGNPSMIWVETEGGANPATVNTEKWTDAQVVTLAHIARWAHDTEGTPLQVMPNSLPASRGIGTHRLGITHSRGLGAVPGWRISRGESWSSHVGKECPGNAKVAQLPAIIRLALQQGDPDVALTDDQAKQLQAIYDRLTPGDAKKGKPTGATWGTLNNIEKGVAALLARDPNIDAAALAAAIPDELAKEVADELGKRIAPPAA